MIAAITVQADPLPAIIAAIGAITASVIGVYLGKRVSEVHTLVNSQLTDLKVQLKAVTDQLSVVTRERDTLDPARADPPPE